MSATAAELEEAAVRILPPGGGNPTRYPYMGLPLLWKAQPRRGGAAAAAGTAASAASFMPAAGILAAAGILSRILSTNNFILDATYFGCLPSSTLGTDHFIPAAADFILDAAEFGFCIGCLPSCIG